MNPNMCLNNLLKLSSNNNCQENQSTSMLVIKKKLEQGSKLFLENKDRLLDKDFQKQEEEELE